MNETALSGIFGLRDPDNSSLGAPPGSVSPRVDRYESDRSLLFFADLPGVEEEQLSLEVEGDVMVLSGERPAKSLPGQSAPRSAAVRYYRRFGIPRGIDLGEVDARLSNGVLRIKVPKVALPATAIAVTGKVDEPAADNEGIDWSRLSVPPSEPPSGKSTLNLGSFLAGPRSYRSKPPPKPPSSRSKLRSAAVVTEHRASQPSIEEIEEISSPDWVLE
ncbi:MAG: Hsp20/alpha crystallin family protein [Polyangiaceae bacterium]|nr:Hsp20/alpha crystallin family protein [Myxococcales bacterium]MCB9584513.1 Hsp20/alpha crystallin family protein [Polyangiaceae bacterium]MCB9609357.1 Hsp20/alpha crystallin family protein [Polyangiaceae bacterium]